MLRLTYDDEMRSWCWCICSPDWGQFTVDSQPRDTCDTAWCRKYLRLRKKLVSSGTVCNSRTEGWEERVQRRIVCPSQILTGWWNTRTTMNKLSWSGTKASGRIILNQHKNSLTKTVSDSRNWAWNSFLSLIILLTWKWLALTRIDCPDGKLTANSFRKIYSKCFPSGNVNEFCDHVFRTFDTDKNGFIDFKEFLLAIDVTSTGSPEEKLEWAFR